MSYVTDTRSGDVAFSGISSFAGVYFVEPLITPLTTHFCAMT